MTCTNNIKMILAIILVIIKEILKVVGKFIETDSISDVQ